MVFKSLPWLVNRNLCLKTIKYRNIFLILLFQYCVQKYLACINPKLDFLWAGIVLRVLWLKTISKVLNYSNTFLSSNLSKRYPETHILGLYRYLSRQCSFSKHTHTHALRHSINTFRIITEKKYFLNHFNFALKYFSYNSIKPFLR